MDPARDIPEGATLWGMTTLVITGGGGRLFLNTGVDGGAASTSAFLGGDAIFDGFKAVFG